MTKVRKFILLSSEEKKLLGRSIFWVLLIRICLWSISFNKLNTWLKSRGSVKSSDKSLDWSVVKNIARAVETSSYYVPQASCLTQALAMRTLLLERGQNSVLKFGVRKDENDKVTAHAWLEIDEKIVIGRLNNLQCYSVMSNSY